jgi:hypothetical protein
MAEQHDMVIKMLSLIKFRRFLCFLKILKNIEMDENNITEQYSEQNQNVGQDFPIFEVPEVTTQLPP